MCAITCASLSKGDLVLCHTFKICFRVIYFDVCIALFIFF